jgi:hypothetical protein
MNENEIVQDDEISLFDLWEKLRDGWRYVVGATMLGVVGAGLAIMQQPLKYEAVAIAQVGQVGQVGQVAIPGQPGQAVSLPVEPVSQAIERMRTSAFQLRVADAVGHQAWRDDLMKSTAATTKYISLQILKTSGQLIELKSSAATPELARDIALASINELAKRQSDLSKPMIDKTHSDLLIARDRLASAEREFQSISKWLNSVGVKDDRFTQLSLMTNLRVQKQSEAFQQRQSISALETALSGPYTRPAEVLEEVFVTTIFPKKTLFLALGLIGGLLAGVVALFFVDAWRRAKRERAGR